MISIKDYTTEQKAALLKKYKYFVLTGTHNSGKSTILNKFSGAQIHYITQASSLNFSGTMKEIQNQIIDFSLNKLDIPRNDEQCKYVLNWIHDYDGIELTILNERIRDPRFYCVGEMIRELSKAEGISFNPSNPVQYLESEKMLFNFFLSMKHANHYKPINKYFIYDRNIFDPLYYMKYTLSHNRDFNQKTTCDQKEYLLDIYRFSMMKLSEMIYQKSLNNTLFLLLDPIPKIVDDGTRNTDPECQMMVYNIAKNMLEISSVDYISISAAQGVKLLNLLK